MFVTAGSTVFAGSASTDASNGGTNFTSVLSGPKMHLTCTANIGEKGAGTLCLKDPYLWHNWRTVSFEKTGQRTKTTKSADGSSKAKWKGMAQNTKVTIRHY